MNRTVGTALAVIICAVIGIALLSLVPRDTPPPTLPASEPLCSYRDAVIPGQQVYAPCSEGDRFAASMRQQGYPDNALYYMPQVAADTCTRKAAGQPLVAWGVGDGDDLDRAYRQAEVAARCP